MKGENSKQWFAVDVTVQREAAEAIESAFNDVDALGTEINTLKQEQSATLLVTGYFDKTPAVEGIANELRAGLAIYGFSADAISDIRTRVVADADWLFEWKKHWQPTEVGRFVVAPPWADIANTGKIGIRIEPNMAFGTGTHETTQLCLKAIDENYKPGMSLLDVGTGTGILAIATAKLATDNTETFEEVSTNISAISVSSVANIFACDTDGDSITIAKQNAAANSVCDNIEFSVGSMTSETPMFDFVCANLTLDVITPLLPLLLEKSRHLLLLSGILVEQEGSISAELLKLQVTNSQVKRAGEWISILINVAEARTK